MKKVISVFVILIFLTTKCTGQQYIGIDYGLVLNQNLDFKQTELRSNYCLLYKTYLSKNSSIDIGFGKYKHDIQSHYTAYDSATVQDYTMRINLNSEYLRIPINYSFRLTNSQKKSGVIIILGCKLGYLLNKNIVTESYDVLESGPGVLNLYTVSNSQNLNITNNPNIKRFDLGYQAGVAYEINKILFGGLRFYFAYNGSLLKNFKKGSLDIIDNGNELTGFKWKWLNANITYFVKISDKTSYIKFSSKNSDKKIKAVY